MDKLVYDGATGETVLVPLTPEEEADYLALADASAAAAMTASHTEQIATDADAERLQLVEQRAAEDPAFAALADLALKTPGS